MQRKIVLDMAEQAAARSLSTLHPIEREPEKYAFTPEILVGVALVQQLEAIRLTLLATMTTEHIY